MYHSNLFRFISSQRKHYLKLATVTQSNYFHNRVVYWVKGQYYSLENHRA